MPSATLWCGVGEIQLEVLSLESELANVLFIQIQELSLPTRQEKREVEPPAGAAI